MQSLPSSRKLFPIEARTWSSASLSNTRNTSMDFAVVVTSNCCQENLNRVIPILLVLTVLWTFFLSSCITTCTAPGSTWGLSSPLCHLFFFFYPSWLRWRHTLLHHVWTGFVFLRRIAHPCHLYQRRRQELAQERRGLYCPQIVLVESIWEFFLSSMLAFTDYLTFSQMLDGVHFTHATCPYRSSSSMMTRTNSRTPTCLLSNPTTHSKCSWTSNPSPKVQEISPKYLLFALHVSQPCASSASTYSLNFDIIIHISDIYVCIIYILSNSIVYFLNKFHKCHNPYQW